MFEDNPTLGKELVNSYRNAFFQVFITLLVAYFSVPYISDYLCLSIEEVKIIRIAAIGLVAWVVLGRRGTQSWDGKTTAEICDNWLFKSLYLAGVYIGCLGILIEPRHYCI